MEEHSSKAETGWDVLSEQFPGMEFDKNNPFHAAVGNAIGTLSMLVSAEQLDLCPMVVAAEAANAIGPFICDECEESMIRRLVERVEWHRENCDKCWKAAGRN